MSTEEDDELARRQRNAVYDAEDEAEEARSAPEAVTELPEMDFSGDDTPDVISGVDNREPDTTTAADFPSEATRSPMPDPKAAIAKYVASGEKPDPQAPLRAKLSEIAGRKYQPSAGLADADIERARADRRAQVGRNDFTQAIQAALLRKPFTPTPPEDVAGGLMARRRGEQADFERSRGLEFDATKALGRGLATGKAPPALTPYQIEQLKRADADDARAAEEKKTKAENAERDLGSARKNFAPILKRMGVDPTTATQKDVDRAIEIDKAEASRELARAGQRETKEQHITEGAKDLATKLGDPAAFQAKYDRIVALRDANKGEIPGLGIVEGVRQQPGIIGSVVRTVSPPDAKAIEGRKLLRQLAAEYARSISGAGVSDKEAERLKAATIDVDTDDSRIAMSGLDTLKDMYESKIASAKAGARPEAVERVEGAAKPAQRPIPTPDPAAEQPPPGVIPPNAKSVKKLKSGKWYYELNGEPETVGPF